MSYLNRMGNSKNPYQGEMKKVLCVCSAGLLRSPTIAWILSNDHFNFNTRAVGYSSEYALIPIDAVLVNWADEIIVVEQKIKKFILDEFKDFNRTIHVVEIPDKYETRHPELIEIATNELLKIYEI